MTEWVLLGVAVVLLLACGVFVAAEFAFVTVDRGLVERRAESGDRAAAGTLKALRTLSTQLSGAQLGITLTNLAIGFLAEPALAALLRTPVRAVGLPEGAVGPVALAVALVLANLLTMIYGELVPKNLAIAKPLEVANAVQPFMRAFTLVLTWPIRLCNGVANAVVRMLGLEPQEELRSVPSADEIASLVRRSAEKGTLDTETADLVERTLLFGDRTADDIMTPRMRMRTVSTRASVTEVIESARSTGYSRFPVVDTSSDDVVGMVHVKHAVSVPMARRSGVSVREILTEPVLVPSSLELDPLLVLLREGLQMAVVVDEFGGTAGMVTMEDVIEEIVGDITDEHDRLTTQARLTKRGWLVSGLLRPDELYELTGFELPEGDHYDTVAGLFLERFGALPVTGDSIRVLVQPPPRHREAGGHPPDLVVTLRIERMDGRRIDWITITTAGPRTDLDQASRS